MAQRLNPIHLRHFQVKQQQIRLQGFGLINGLDARAGLANNFKIRLRR
jgi:hypothetical protein